MIDRIKEYHIHLYYDVSTIDVAKRVAMKACENYEIELGRFHEKNVGPHPRWSVQLLIKKEDFGEILSWVALHREGLTIFTHPVTDNDLLDHTDYAIWMGEKLDLDLSIF